ncbi:tyrosine-type recombinase/integrase [Pseudomonas paralactis]|uniref:Tyrosine-type recombinase/integrase n=2 Tax=Pseudomonas TaxID=286 RepID=A0A5N7JNH7_9PSED|nr:MULTISPECIES: tyrosine-type recombinase/integrase [Pseudomonas]MBI6636064.1 tyrosine-type recombinase/integrase [Pseudomonas paralactis]MPQ82948.1 tyrosine-type recombinase/integrase [Pseudomonas kitaguniensis]
MRPRNTENRDLPPGMVRRKRPRKNGKVWVGYYYRDSTGKEIPLGGDLSKARLKWAELESKEKPADLTMMKGIFDRYVRDVIPKKGERTQKDNLAELKQLRPMFDGAPIDSITPANIAGYRDARTAKVRANREIALLSHVFNMAREWGLTERENPCQGIRKNKETPRDYYANAAVWDAVYGMAEPELKEAMDLGYLTGQRPADVIVMRRDDIEGDYFLVTQGKTGLKLRILMYTEEGENSLGRLIREITERNAGHVSKYLLINRHGKRMTKGMLRLRWDKAREKACAKAIEEGDPLLAAKIGGFQFRDIRPKAASEIIDIGDASLLLGHSKQEITKRVYRRIGATAKPSK